MVETHLLGVIKITVTNDGHLQNWSYAEESKNPTRITHIDARDV